MENSKIIIKRGDGNNPEIFTEIADGRHIISVPILKKKSNINYVEDTVFSVEQGESLKNLIKDWRGRVKRNFQFTLFEEDPFIMEACISEIDLSQKPVRVTLKWIKFL